MAPVAQLAAPSQAALRRVREPRMGPLHGRPTPQLQSSFIQALENSPHSGEVMLRVVSAVHAGRGGGHRRPADGRLHCRRQLPGLLHHLLRQLQG